MTDDTNSGAEPWRGCVPVIQEVPDGGVMALVGRARWSREIVVQTHLVHRADRGLSIVIGSQQHSFGSRSDQADSARNEMPSSWHRLVGKQHGHRLPVQGAFADDVETRPTGIN